MKIIQKLLSLGRSIILNIYLFNIKDAFKLPLLVKYNTKIYGLRRGCIVLNGNITRGMVSIGITRGTILGDAPSPPVLQFEKEGIWKIEDKAWVSGYSVIKIGGVLETHGFSSNSGLKISCAEYIHIGNDVLMGWDVLIIDSDGHNIIIDDSISNLPKPVFIGNHIWLCANVTVIKGTYISDNSVVAMGSIVSKKFEKTNLLISGNQIKKENINWKH